MINWGVIGFGRMGKQYVDCFKIKSDLFENYDLVISYGYRHILSKQQLEMLNKFKDSLNNDKNYPGSSTFSKAISKIKE